MVTLIGQQANKERINKWPTLPNFMIFEGEKGSGRKTLIRYIAETFDADSILVSNKVDDIRDIIQDTSTLFKERIYILDGDTMSIGAKNSLLKITEEPPNKCHIALLVSSTEKTLPTLVSRANVITMLPYSLEEKSNYLESKVAMEDERMYLEYARMASNLGEFEPMIDFGIQYIYEKVWALYDSIWIVSESNALNISSWMKLKKNDDEDKMEPLMFFKALYNIGSWITIKDSKDMTWGEVHNHNRFLLETSKCIRRLQNRSASIEITVNKWIRQVTSIE